MFTGIVESVGTISAVEGGHNVRVTIAAPFLSATMQDADSNPEQPVKLGDSIAVSGCCLTVVAFDATTFAAELSRETLAKTAPRWHVGSRVNLERAMRLGDRLGGHVVSGHVDGVGEVLEVLSAPGSYMVRVAAPAHLATHLVPKGSVTVDGVSLTLVDVGGPGGSKPEWPSHHFSLWLVPHTLSVTTLGELEAGSAVNIESDVLAKYVERLQLVGKR